MYVQQCAIMTIPIVIGSSNSYRNIPPKNIQFSMNEHLRMHTSFMHVCMQSSVSQVALNPNCMARGEMNTSIESQTRLSPPLPLFVALVAAFKTENTLLI